MKKLSIEPMQITKIIGVTLYLVTLPFISLAREISEMWKWVSGHILPGRLTSNQPKKVLPLPALVRR